MISTPLTAIPSSVPDGKLGASHEPTVGIFSLLSVIFPGLGLVVAIIALPCVTLAWNKLQSKRKPGDLEIGVTQPRGSS